MFKFQNANEEAISDGSRLAGLRKRLSSSRLSITHSNDSVRFQKSVTIVDSTSREIVRSDNFKQIRNNSAMAAIIEHESENESETRTLSVSRTVSIKRSSSVETFASFSSNDFTDKEYGNFNDCYYLSSEEDSDADSELSDPFSREAPLLTSVLHRTHRKHRKRAFSVDLPIQYIFAQKAPLARFESKGSVDLKPFRQLILAKQRQQFNDQNKLVGSSDVSSGSSLIIHSESSLFSNKRERCNTEANPKKKSLFNLLKHRTSSKKQKQLQIKISQKNSLNSTPSKDKMGENQLKPSALKSSLQRTRSVQDRGTASTKRTRIRFPSESASTASSTNDYEIYAADSSQDKVDDVVIRRQRTKRSSITGSFIFRKGSSRKKDHLSIKRIRKRERQAERALILVLFFLMCLWLPYFAVNFVYGINPTYVNENVRNALHIFAISSTGNLKF